MFGSRGGGLWIPFPIPATPICIDTFLQRIFVSFAPSLPFSWCFSARGHPHRDAKLRPTSWSGRVTPPLPPAGPPLAFPIKNGDLRLLF
jgi:hypothetical protein